MYIGPSRPYKLPLMTNAIILDNQGVAGLQEALKEHAELKILFVPIEKLGVSRILVKEKGTPLYNAYMKVKLDTEKLKSGGK